MSEHPARHDRPARLVRPLTVDEYQRISHVHQLAASQNLVNAQTIAEHSAPRLEAAAAAARADYKRSLAQVIRSLEDEHADIAERIARKREEVREVEEDFYRLLKRSTQDRLNARARLSRQRRSDTASIARADEETRLAIAEAEARTRAGRERLAVALEDEQRIEDAYREACARIKLHWRKLAGRNEKLAGAGLPEVEVSPVVWLRRTILERELAAHSRGRLKVS